MSEFLQCLVALTFASSSAIVIVLLIRRPIRNAFGAAAAYSTWLLVLAATVAALLPGAPDTSSAMRVSFQIEPISALSDVFDKSVDAIGASASSAVHGPSPSAVSPFAWSTWILGTWSLGATLLFVYFAGVQRAFVGSLGALSGARCVLRAERSVGCPALIGVLRPKIILPLDFEARYTRLERLLVLTHERVHLRRRDTAWNALVALLRCLFWFNPLVHLAAPRLRLDQELACDAAVMERHAGLRRTYADAMLKTQMADACLPVGCHWQSARQLKERLKLLKRSVPSRARRTCGGAFVALCSILAGYTAWAAEPPGNATAAGPFIAQVNTRPPTSTSLVNAVAGSDLPLTLEVGDEVLSFGRDTRLLPSATGFAGPSDYVTAEPAHSRTLRGDVRFESFPWPEKRVTIAHSSDELPRSETVEAQSIVVQADRAVMIAQPGGAITVTFENGCSVKLRSRSAEVRSIAGRFCRLQNYNMLPQLWSALMKAQ